MWINVSIKLNIDELLQIVASSFSEDYSVYKLAEVCFKMI